MRKTSSLLMLLILNTFYSYGEKQMDEPTSYTDDLTLEWKKNGETINFIAKSKILTPIQIYFYSKKSNEELKKR